MLLLETILIGWRLFARDTPMRLVVTTFWTRSIGECFLFMTLAIVSGGKAKADHSFIGAVVVTMAFYGVAVVTDVPLRDRWEGTYPKVATSTARPIALFLCRSSPLMVHAVAGALVALVVVGILTGRAALVLDLVPAAPLLAVGAASCIAAGLCVVAPTIGTRIDVVSYNVMLGLVVTCSGAVIPRGTAPVIDLVGNVLPLTHTVSAFRAVAAEGPFWHHVGMEAVVAFGWAFSAAMLYSCLQRRGRSRGTGAFV